MKSNSYIEWCNENEGRAYPVSEEATRVDDTGKRLPDDLIVDLGILLPQEFTGLRISSMYASAQLISLAISADVGGLLTATYVRSTVVPYTAYPLTGLIDDVSGWVVFGDHRTVVTEHYRFSTPAQSAVEQRPVRVIPPPEVKRFQRIGNDPTVYATGIVKLVTGAAFVVERDPENPQNIIIRLNGDMKTKFLEPCTRPASKENCEVPPLRRIANVPANENGEITLRFE
jgi:hypothetical protein